MPVWPICNEEKKTKTEKQNGERKYPRLSLKLLFHIIGEYVLPCFSNRFLNQFQIVFLGSAHCMSFFLFLCFLFPPLNDFERIFGLCFCT
mmetsp:Transcript_16382/g.28330  ORF Transcript_16382/g.28330 Transcript_16382/m.28330 type:complete len:90 (-) Transcript_16382:124-393(-)